MQENLVELTESDLDNVAGGNLLYAAGRFLLELGITYALEAIAGAGSDPGGYNLSELNAP